MRIAYAAEERTGVCSRRHRCSSRTPKPTRPDEEQGGAASQEENDGMVSVARPQGTAPMPPSLFARRLRPYVGRVFRTGYNCRRDSRSRPGSTGNYEQSEGGESVMTTPSRNLAVQISGKRRPGGASVKWGQAKGTGAAILGSRVREAGPPPTTSRVTSRGFFLTLGRPM